MLCTLAGCKDESARNKASEAESTAKAATAAIEELKASIEAAKQRAEALQEEIETLKFSSNSENFARDYKINRLHSAVFKTLSAEPSVTGGGYDLARNPYGAFPILIENAIPYLNGHKVKFAIGNPTSVTVSNGTFTVKWNREEVKFPETEHLPQAERTAAYMKYIAEKEAWEKNERATEQKISGITPGSWSYVEVILSPSKPDELSSLRVDFEITGVSLSKNTK